MNDRGKIVPMGGRRRAAPSAQHVAEFAEIARRMREERDTAANVVEVLLRETPRPKWNDLAGREELQTCGALEKLGNRVAQLLKSDPNQALDIARLAVAVTEQLSPNAYHPVVLAQLRVHAWKDVGQALAYLGRYDEALTALDRAESDATTFGTLAHDHAIVRFVRATTLQEVDRHDESLALLARCKAVFRDHADHRRLLLCGIAEGVLLHRLHRYREAREAYLLLLAGTGNAIDRESAACLHNVIGHCSIDLGDYDVAETYLSRAIELFHELGQTLQAAKAELGRGRLFVRIGQLARGVAHLRAIRAEFLRHELIEEAGLCGLEIVEAQLLRDEAAEAERMARQIIAEFSRAGLNTRAITALGFLQEAIAARRASTAMVSNVREFIVSLRKTPEREFVAST
jgi:tetratricopeptide (TPR) repeat protein